jgi:hypothetical protein
MRRATRIAGVETVVVAGIVTRIAHRDSRTILVGLATAAGVGIAIWRQRCETRLL